MAVLALSQPKDSPITALREAFEWRGWDSAAAIHGSSCKCGLLESSSPDLEFRVRGSILGVSCSLGLKRATHTEPSRSSLRRAAPPSMSGCAASTAGHRKRLAVRQLVCMICRWLRMPSFSSWTSDAERPQPAVATAGQVGSCTVEGCKA